MKKCYIWMIIIGIIATLIYIITIWTEIVWDTILNIVLTMGSGVLCSAIVAWISESIQKKNDGNKKREQRNYILSVVKNLFLILFSSEYKNLSEYLILNDKSNKYKTISKEIKVENVLDELNVMLEQITDNVTTSYQLPDIIDSNYLMKINKRNELAFRSLLCLYERLNKDLLKIYEDSNIYFLDEVFNKGQIEKIHNIQMDIDSIIACSNENDIELLFEIKRPFIKDIKKSLDVFNIKPSERIKCYYKSIVK